MAEQVSCGIHVLELFLYACHPRRYMAQVAQTKGGCTCPMVPAGTFGGSRTYRGEVFDICLAQGARGKHVRRGDSRLVCAPAQSPQSVVYVLSVGTRSSPHGLWSRIVAYRNKIQRPRGLSRRIRRLYFWTSEDLAGHGIVKIVNRCWTHQ